MTQEALKLALETVEGIANSDWRKWEELASPAEFERWAKSRANFMATILREALAQPDQYAKGYADAMNWKVQNHLEHLPTAQPEQEPVAWVVYSSAENDIVWADKGKRLKQNTPLYTTPPQPDRYITDAMKVRQAVAQALIDDVYAKELEQPEAKQSGTISITAPAPIAYLCENATGHKYFRWKKPSSVYKPIPLYTTPPPCPTCEALARTVMLDQTGRDA